MSPDPSRWHSVRRIVALAWPVYVGQMSVVAFSVIDTVLVARHSTQDLAALGIGAATYMTVFIGLMGVVLGLSPIVGQLQGAGRLKEAGDTARQAIWLALLLSLLGCSLLVFPQPILAYARLEPVVEAKARAYLGVLAFSLPASLLFTVFRGFNTAVSRPKAVMVLQLGGLALKLPLSLLLLSGAPALGIPALGVVGCALGTAICLWGQLLAAWWLLRRDAFYRPYRRSADEVARQWFPQPNAASLKALLRLGVPIGAATFIEVTGFTLMAVFIARLGTASVAAHQIASNLVGISFMVPLALANAICTLVAQSVGARDHADARRLGWHGLQLGVSAAVAVGLVVLLLREPIARLYTADPAVLVVCTTLLAWLAIFHIFDAAQTVVAFVLRAWHVATVPMLIYVAALWGVGLGGGYWLAFDVGGATPSWLRAAPGYWAAATAGLAVASLALTLFLSWMLKQPARSAP